MRKIIRSKPAGENILHKSEAQEKKGHYETIVLETIQNLIQNPETSPPVSRKLTVLLAKLMQKNLQFPEAVSKEDGFANLIDQSPDSRKFPKGIASNRTTNRALTAMYQALTTPPSEGGYDSSRTFSPFAA